MKTKFIQPLIWALALLLALPACKKDKGNTPDDPYSPPTEGLVFMPVLVHKVDMEKVKETEKARGGRLKKVTHSKKGKYDAYVFSYEGKYITEITYEVNTSDKMLLKVMVKVPITAGVTGMEKLLKKVNFNTDHILTKMIDAEFARETEEHLFTCETENVDVGKWFNFEQYETQKKPMQTIEHLNESWFDFLYNENFKISQVRGFEHLNSNGSLEDEKKVESGKYRNQVRYAKYRANPGYAPQIIRGYFFDWDEDLSPQKVGYIKEIIFVYTDPALGVYRDNRHKMDIPTREIIALLKKGGFEIKNVTQVDNTFFYYFKNEAKNLTYVLRAKGFDDIEGGRKVMSLNLF